MNFFFSILAALGLHHFVRFVCVCGGSEWGLLNVTVSGLLVVVASLVSEHRL